MYEKIKISYNYVSISACRIDGWQCYYWLVTIIGGHINDDLDETSLELSNTGEDEHATVSDVDVNIDFQQEAAFFLLKAEEERRLTQVRAFMHIYYGIADC